MKKSFDDELAEIFPISKEFKLVGALFSGYVIVGIHKLLLLDFVKNHKAEVLAEAQEYEADRLKRIR